MQRVTVMTLVLVLSAPVIWAGSLAGVTMDDQVTISGKSLQLNGMGLRKKLWVKVYVGGLYLESRASNTDQIVSSGQTIMVAMHFLTDRATKAKMDEAWREGFEANSPQSYAALKSRVETFIAFFGDMKEGDEIKMAMVPGEGTTVTLNGQEKGKIEGDDFAKALLLVWLGSAPPTEELKEGMLGQ
jgi:hypothetical protein